MGNTLLWTEDDEEPVYCVEDSFRDEEEEEEEEEEASPSLTVGMILSDDLVASPAWHLLVALSVPPMSVSIVNGIILVPDPLRPEDMNSCWVLWVTELTVTPSLAVGMTRSSPDELDEQLSLLDDATTPLDPSPLTWRKKTP